MTTTIDYRPAIAGALVGTVLGLALSIPAQSQTVSPVVREHLAISRTVQQAGFTLLRDTPDCREEKMYGYVDIPTKSFVICFDNHPEESNAELFDTVRHEAIHVAQYCKGGMLLPQYKDRMIADAQDIGWGPLSYEPKAWGFEAEAHMLAHHMTPQQIQQILRKYCF